MNKLSIDTWIKPEVRAQPAYSLKDVPYQIKLNQNECPWDWPDELKQEILERLRRTSWNRYPELIPQRLKEILAADLGITSAQVVVGKGSNELLQALAMVSLRPDDVLCTLSPTFANYRLLGERMQARVVDVPLTRTFQLDTKAFFDKCSNARLTLLCNPNSPTGSLIPLDVIQQIASCTSGILVVDEAYVDFSGVTALSLVDDQSNLVITRTFSKAFALAGFRLGYAVMHPNLAEDIQKGLLPYNIDTPSAIAAEVLLEYKEIVQERVEVIISERKRLLSHLSGLSGVQVWDSKANFFLLSTPLGAQGTFKALAEKGILVRDISTYPGCENVVRISVGAPEENDALLQAVEALC
jgi:histidinol-phosphate aminotransferase